jgi:hypothetical protein
MWSIRFGRLLEFPERPPPDGTQTLIGQSRLLVRLPGQLRQIKSVKEVFYVE